MRNFASLAFAPLLLLASVGAGRADDASDKQAFHDFLVQAKSGTGADKDKVAAFYKTAGAYWRNHWLDYTNHPENYADVMALYHEGQAIYQRPFQVPDPERYRKDIELFKEFDAKNALPKNPALFVGSSTIMKWKTAEAFPGFSVINRGFGGSVTEDVQYYYKDVIGKYHPSAVLFYCDNDVTGGGDPDHAFDLAMARLSQGAGGLSQGAVRVPQHEACAQFRFRESGRGQGHRPLQRAGQGCRPKRIPISNISTWMRR